MEKISTFGDRLRLMLNEKGLSQADFCRLSDLDRSKVSKYLRGLKARPIVFLWTESTKKHCKISISIFQGVNHKGQKNTKVMYKTM